MAEFITATYEVELGKQAEFMGVLKDCEILMRREGFITERGTIWMQSKENPKMIMEIFELVDDKAFGLAQENDELMALWGKLVALWVRGGFAANELPEAQNPWAMYKAIG